MVIELCEDAIHKSNMTIVSCMYKKFVPHGVTALWLLQESHFSLHTYPEHCYISIDCYTCGDEGESEIAVNSLLSSLDVLSVSRMSMPRGNSIETVGGDEG